MKPKLGYTNLFSPSHLSPLHTDRNANQHSSLSHISQIETTKNDCYNDHTENFACSVAAPK